MRVAVGIIGLVLSMIVLLQSCTVTGLSNLGGQRAMAEAGSLGVLTAALMFFGGAFAFGMPVVSRVLFVLGFLVSIPARKEFPDMWVWGIASLILAVLLQLAKSERWAEPALAAPRPEPPRWNPAPARAAPPPLPATAAAPPPLWPAGLAAPGSGSPAPSYDLRKWKVLKEVDEEIAAAAARVAALGSRFEAELAERYLTLNDRAYLAQIERRVTETAQAHAAEAAELAARLDAENLESSRREMESYLVALRANRNRDPGVDIEVSKVEPYVGAEGGMLGGIKITLQNGDTLLRKGKYCLRFGSEETV